MSTAIATVGGLYRAGSYMHFKGGVRPRVVGKGKCISDYGPECTLARSTGHKMFRVIEME